MSGIGVFQCSFVFFAFPLFYLLVIADLCEMRCQQQHSKNVTPNRNKFFVFLFCFNGKNHTNARNINKNKYKYHAYRFSGSHFFF